MSSSPSSQTVPEDGDEAVRVRRFRPSRRALLAIAVLVLAALAIVLVVADPFAGGGGSNGGVVDNTFPTGVATVTRQSLSSQTQVSATLGYADPATIVEPAGTAPSDLQQAQQSVVADKGMLQVDEATLSSDRSSLAQLQASLSAARAKQAVDCVGVNAAQSASSPSSAGGGSDAGGGGSSSGACASDVQAVSTDDQSLSGDLSKVSGDQSQVSAATRTLAADEANLVAARSSSASYGQSSTFTTLPAVGLIVKRDQTLYAVSGQPVVLLYGSVAPWRALSLGMSPGRDVAELNANLRLLGYGKGLTGDRFGAATVAAIDRFQAAHGLSRTGELPLGSVVFEPGPVRVTSVTPTVGATVQAGPVLTISSTVREVVIALDAAQQAQVKVGDVVSITLPDNRTTPGRVSYVGTVATTPSSSGDQGGGGGSDTPTIEVDVKPTDPAATGRLDQAPVNVSITTASVKNVLVVPVSALLALGSGGYALEEIGAGGAHHLVGVDIGLFDDATGLVQVSGAGVAAGQRVVVPGE